MRAGENIFCAETLQVAGTDKLSSHYELVGLQKQTRCGKQFMVHAEACHAA